MDIASEHHENCLVVTVKEQRIDAAVAVEFKDTMRQLLEGSTGRTRFRRGGSGSGGGGGLGEPCAGRCGAGCALVGRGRCADRARAYGPRGAGADLGAIGDEPTEEVDVLPVDVLDLLLGQDADLLLGSS